MTLEATVVSERAVRATADGYEVQLHLPWYRSLPLSCVEDIRITVAGRAASRDQMRVLIGGTPLRLDDLGGRIDDEWFVQDALTIHVTDPSAIRKGAEVDVEVILATRIPYITLAPGAALVKPTRVKRRVVVQ